jgi:hypothetical protein
LRGKKRKFLSAKYCAESGWVIVSKLPSSFILTCTTEIKYRTVSLPVLATFNVCDFLEPSNTILRGYKSRSPWANDIIGRQDNANKSKRQKFTCVFAQRLVKNKFCTGWI